MLFLLYKTVIFNGFVTYKLWVRNLSFHYFSSKEIQNSIFSTKYLSYVKFYSWFWVLKSYNYCFFVSKTFWQNRTNLRISQPNTKYFLNFYFAFFLNFPLETVLRLFRKFSYPCKILDTVIKYSSFVKYFQKIYSLRTNISWSKLW